jgi:hypothetical protein
MLPQLRRVRNDTARTADLGDRPFRAVIYGQVDAIIRTVSTFSFGAFAAEPVGWVGIVLVGS